MVLALLQYAESAKETVSKKDRRRDDETNRSKKKHPSKNKVGKREREDQSVPGNSHGKKTLKGGKRGPGKAYPLQEKKAGTCMGKRPKNGIEVKKANALKSYRRRLG